MHFLRVIFFSFSFYLFIGAVMQRTQARKKTEKAKPEIINKLNSIFVAGV
jgi:hypothetical protein